MGLWDTLGKGIQNLIKQVNDYSIEENSRLASQNEHINSLKDKYEYYSDQELERIYKTSSMEEKAAAGLLIKKRMEIAKNKYSFCTNSSLIELCKNSISIDRAAIISLLKERGVIVK